MEIRSVEVELSHAEGRTDRLEVNSPFLQFSDRVKQILKSRIEGKF